MTSGARRPPNPLAELPDALKILVAGHLGVGKTTFVSTVSEIQPLRTEEIAMDFGRITLREDLVLYLFGTPGRQRFPVMWDELSAGAVGAIVLADTRRIEDVFGCVDYFEKRCTPFIVAVNRFESRRGHQPNEVRMALGLDPRVPVLACDARDRESCKTMLIGLIEHVISTSPGLELSQRLT